MSNTLKYLFGDDVPQPKRAAKKKAAPRKKAAPKKPAPAPAPKEEEDRPLKSVARLKGKVRRVVTIRKQGRSYLVKEDFDLTFTPRGIIIRLAGTSNRKRLFRPWHEVIDGCINERQGYRVWSLEQAIANLEDIETTLEKLG